MKNFINFLVKHKTVIAVLVLIVMIGMLMPSPSPVLAFRNRVCESRWWTKVPCWVASIPPLIAAYASDGIFWVALQFARLVEWLTSKAIMEIIANETGKFSITNAKTTTGADTIGGAVFLVMWSVMRDWANMVVVVALIIIATATILNIEKYKAQKLLVTLIVVALLINFSIVFVGLMIDFANVVMRYFLGGFSISNQIARAWDNIMRLYVVGGRGFYDAYPTALFYISFNYIFVMFCLLIALSLIYFMLMFIERFAMLGVLFIFSPLAFSAYILPPSRSLTDKWWHNFLDWLFKGVIGMFFIGLASRMLQNIPTAIISGGSEPLTNANFWTKIINIGFYLVIVLVFLLIGYKVAKKSSVFAAKVVELYKKIQAIVIQAVLAAVTGGASAAASGAGFMATMGAAAKSGLKAGVAKATTGENQGSQAVGNILKTQGSRAMEAVGLASRGTTAGLRKKQMAEKLKEPMERLQNLSADDLADHAVNALLPAERAAATLILKQRKKLNRIGAANREAAMRNAMAHDPSLMESDFAESDYRYAGFDERAVDRAEARVVARRARSGRAPLSATQVRARAQRLVRRERLENSLPSMSNNQAAEIDDADITYGLVTSPSFSASTVRKFSTAGDAVVNALKSHLPRIRARISSPALAGNNNKSERERLTRIADAIDDL